MSVILRWAPSKTVGLQKVNLEKLGAMKRQNIQLMLELVRVHNLEYKNGGMDVVYVNN